MWPAVPTTTCFMGRSAGVVRPSSPDAADLVELLLVVLPEEDVPLLASLGDRPALLAHDLGADAAVDLLVLPQLESQQIQRLEADLVPVAREPDARHALERLEDDVGEVRLLLVGELHRFVTGSASACGPARS